MIRERFLINREGGFTLIELLIVLLVVSIVAIFILPSMYKIVSRQEQLHFFKLYSSDVLYVQNQALYTDERLDIILNKQTYEIKSRFNQDVRAFPNELSFATSSRKVSFTSNGTLRAPDTHLFNYPAGQYRVTFPFGKGRGYLGEL